MSSQSRNTLLAMGTLDAQCWCCIIPNSTLWGSPHIYYTCNCTLTNAFNRVRSACKVTIFFITVLSHGQPNDIFRGGCIITPEAGVQLPQYSTTRRTKFCT